MEQSNETGPSFTGRRRQKKTRLSVKLGDYLSTRIITIGGLGTILAVSLVGAMLIAVAYPLFLDAVIHHERTVAAPWRPSQQPLRAAIDEYQTVGWAIHEDGSLQLFDVASGKELSREQLFDDEQATFTALSVIPDIDDDEAKPDKSESRMQLAAGFDDGTVRLGTISFKTTFLKISDVPEELRKLGIGEIATLEGGVVKVTPQRQFRLQQVIASFDEYKIRFDTEAAVTKIAHGQRGKGFGLAVYTADNVLRFAKLSRRIVEDEYVYRIASKKRDRIVPDYDLTERREPDYLLVPTRGDMVYAAWHDGHLARFNIDLMAEARLAEELFLLDQGDTRLTALDLTLGRETLVAGDSDGFVRAWFPVKRETTSHIEGALPTTDGKLLTPVHTLPRGKAAVTSLGISERTRLIAAGYANGQAAVMHVTTNQLLAETLVAKTDSDQGVPVEFVAIAPKDNGLFATGGETMWRAEFDPRHPEVTWSSLFKSLWYEGYEQPKAMWQSSFADVGPEMKLGLWPLIFGTLKATLYSMLMGAPLALLAAIYTSEFSNPKAKATLKPMVEMMASLPSVVLGFLAGLVLAPFVENIVPQTLCAIATVPFTLLLGAYLWQLIDPTVAIRLERFRFVYCLMMLPVGLGVAYMAGPAMEQLLFAGDIKRWLDGQIGSGTGAWVILLLPFSACIVAGVTMTYVNSWLRVISADWGRRRFVFFNLGKFLAASAATILLAWLLGASLNAAGFDPRGGVLGTYVQRNSLVVGFIMGFAIIPIIYTIAEDALSTVPQHLRTASLGAGATPWQTTIRIVIPTAMSGLFSAAMIGLGRAVGETMIVLMASGNTPLEDFNIFNGFATLAATIATELPEAAKGSTHFRTLFFAALVLFILTFFVNTMAEVVRFRFRKRAIQL